MEDLEDAFDYNKENFRFDAKQWQERGFQEQKMRVDQGKLYRDDVRDLMELTTGKMDLYLIVNALLLDQSVRMLCKGHLDAAPEWLRCLQILSLCSGFLLFFLSLWLAMHASVASHSFAVRLLTQYVRLPIPTEKQLDALQLHATEFEGYSAKDMLRVPLIKVAAKKLEAKLKQGLSDPNNKDARTGAAKAGQRQSSSHSTGVLGENGLQSEGDAVDTDAENVEQTPEVIEVTSLEHVKLYRRMQANFISYDAYARAGTSIGLNSLLFSLWYFCLGIATENASQAEWASWGCCLLMAVNVLLVAKIDFDLGGRSFGLVALLIILPAFFSTAAVTTYRWHWYRFHIYFVLLVFVFHICWVAVVLFLVKAGTDEQVKLPHQFKQVLYLDVFGQWGGFSEDLRAASSSGNSKSGDYRSGNTVVEPVVVEGGEVDINPEEHDEKSCELLPPPEQYLHAYLSVCSLRRLQRDKQVQLPAQAVSLISEYERVASHLLEPLDGHLIPLVCISVAGHFVDNIKKNKEQVACLYDPITKSAIIPGVTAQQAGEQQRVCLPLARLERHLRVLATTESGGAIKLRPPFRQQHPSSARSSDCSVLFEQRGGAAGVVSTETTKSTSGAESTVEEQITPSWNEKLRRRLVQTLSEKERSAIRKEDEKLANSQEPLFNNRYACSRAAEAAENTVTASCAFFPVNHFNRIRMGPDAPVGRNSVIADETLGDSTLGDEQELLANSGRRCWAQQMRPGNVPWFMFLIAMSLFLSLWVVGLLWYCTHIQEKESWSEEIAEMVALREVWLSREGRAQFGKTEGDSMVAGVQHAWRKSPSSRSRVLRRTEGGRLDDERNDVDELFLDDAGRLLTGEARVVRTNVADAAAVSCDHLLPGHGNEVGDSSCTLWLLKFDGSFEVCHWVEARGRNPKATLEHCQMSAGNIPRIGGGVQGFVLSAGEMNHAQQKRATVEVVVLLAETEESGPPVNTDPLFAAGPTSPPDRRLTTPAQKRRKRLESVCARTVGGSSSRSCGNRLVRRSQRSLTTRRTKQLHTKKGQSRREVLEQRKSVSARPTAKVLGLSLHFDRSATAGLSMVPLWERTTKPCPDHAAHVFTTSSKANSCRRAAGFVAVYDEFTKNRILAPHPEQSLLPPEAYDS
ncbi:unnamed protein product [Amoebophrya sp. A120]|nr:unnamed protein product [Amoebophrya sp. A120]|eukprot:GSA120T00003658001.1